jgi:hypothetical protein
VYAAALAAASWLSGVLVWAFTSFESRPPTSKTKIKDVKDGKYRFIFPPSKSRLPVPDPQTIARIRQSGEINTQTYAI